MVSSFHFVFRETGRKKRYIFAEGVIRREKKIIDFFYLFAERHQIISEYEIKIRFHEKKNISECVFFWFPRWKLIIPGGIFLNEWFFNSVRHDLLCVFFQGGGRKKEPAWWNFLIFCFSYVVVLVCFRGCFYVFCPPISHHIAYFRVHSLAKSVYFSWKNE